MSNNILEYNKTLNNKLDSDSIEVIPSMNFSNWNVYYLVKNRKTDKDLDNVSDTYQIIVTDGNYSIKKSLSKSDIKNSLLNEYKMHKLFIVTTLEILATIFCPMLVPAIQEASSMQDDDNNINQGETTIILVPTNTKPVLIKQ